MNEQELFNKELDEIRKNMLIELRQWWGKRYAGYSGIIITNNKEVYEYQYYHKTPEFLKENSNYIRKVKELNKEEFEKINIFIKDEIIAKQFTDKKLYDAGYTVEVSYNGSRKVIENNKGYGENPEIYDIAEKLLEEII